MSEIIPTLQELEEARENGEIIQIYNGDIGYADIPIDEPLEPYYVKQIRYRIKRDIEPFKETELWDADPNCIHEYDPRCYSGIKCLKCRGWFCY